MAKACLHNGITNLEIYTLNSMSNSPKQLTQHPSPSWNVLYLLGILLRSLTRISSSKKSILTMQILDHEVAFRTTQWMRTTTNRVFNVRISNLREQFHFFVGLSFLTYIDSMIHCRYTNIINTNSGVPAGLHYQVIGFKKGSIRDVFAYSWIKFEGLIITTVEKANFGFVFYQGQLCSMKDLESVKCTHQSQVLSEFCYRPLVSSRHDRD
jgi:hypothetical protein